MAELIDESTNMESTTVGVYRTAATVKGGRRFSFGSMVIVGNRRGRVGYGYGKSNEVPSAIEKAQKAAKRNLHPVKMMGGTITHEVEGVYGASRVRLIPASPGTGVVAGATVRAVLEMAGVTDCLTKCYGSTTATNVVKAVFDGLSRLQRPQEIAELRGVEIGQTIIEQRIERAGGSLAAGGEDETPRPEQE